MGIAIGIALGLLSGHLIAKWSDSRAHSVIILLLWIAALFHGIALGANFY